jgi:hypothetical protein
VIKAGENMHDVRTLMREQDFTILRLATANPYYTVSLRAHRGSTKWKDIPFNIGCDSAEKLATTLHLDMLIKIKSYSSAGLQIEKHSLSDDDLLAALHYGAAKFGISSQFYSISSVILNSTRRWEIESPRVHRRPVCLSQATLPDSFKLS